MFPKEFEAIIPIQTDTMVTADEQQLYVRIKKNSNIKLSLTK
jgi:hypothetical protein